MNDVLPYQQYTAVQTLHQSQGQAAVMQLLPVVGKPCVECMMNPAYC